MLPIKEFIAFVDQYDLFDKKKQILATVSGGKDSVLLAHLLKAAGYNFAIAHCNFNLRHEESIRDEAFTANLATQLEVPFFNTTFNTLEYSETHGISIQMAARQLRYDWFYQICRDYNYDVIALAHHINDTMETMLLNLTRGTGIAGMHGILPKKDQLVRPLLFLNRQQIEEIILSNDLHFVEDSSNASTKYARNLIRHEVIPQLKKLNPSLEETFEKNSRRFYEMEQLLDKHLADLHQELVIMKDNYFIIPLDKVQRLFPKKLLLYGLLNKYGFTDPVVDDIIHSLDKHSGRRFESPEFNLLLDRNQLLIKQKTAEDPASVVINPEDKKIIYLHFELHLMHDDSPLIIRDNPMAVSVDSEQLIYPLILRSWEEGDYFYPLGMRHRKKLSDFFISNKIPLLHKTQIPVLVNGNGQLIWIGGYRLDERFKVSSHTKKVTIFELFNRSL